jgi:hypothetical protein
MIAAAVLWTVTRKPPFAQQYLRVPENCSNHDHSSDYGRDYGHNYGHNYGRRCFLREIPDIEGNAGAEIILSFVRKQGIKSVPRPPRRYAYPVRTHAARNLLETWPKQSISDRPTVSRIPLAQAAESRGGMAFKGDRALSTKDVLRVGSL